MEMAAEIRIRVGADDAWALIGTRFGQIAEWASPITVSRLDRGAAALGVIRTCQVSGFGPMGEMVVRERLIAFDKAARSLTYDAVAGMPEFVKHAANRWTVEPDGAGACLVRSRATLRLTWWMRPLGPLMSWRLRREARGVLEELACRLETGRPHPRKIVSSAGHTGAPTV